MALDWSKSNRRKLLHSPGNDGDAALMRMGQPEFEDGGPTKAEINAECAAAIAAYNGPIRKLPTMIDVKCPCGHRRRMAVAPGRVRPRFKCSRCGTRV